MSELPQEYDYKSAEKKWQEWWEAEGTYKWKKELRVASCELREKNTDNSQLATRNFVIDTPPPTVSGLLHMGHIFSYTQGDFIARYQRMRGKNVFYPMGFDDNGLPTERLVEKVKGKKAAQYESREAFIADCREVVAEAEEEFEKLFKSAALSVDWSQKYQTISDESRKLSQMSFLDLYEKGHIYRDFRPTYWDWVDQTAIAQAEVENKEMPGVMNEILFELHVGKESQVPSPKSQKDTCNLGLATWDLPIATTRPELLGACVAVMYHPEDVNAAKYKDQYAITPLFGVKVPMIADEAVEQGKGTGLVMCCTFGDDTDKEWWRKHGLPMRGILSTEGKIRTEIKDGVRFYSSKYGKYDTSNLSEENCVDVKKTMAVFEQLQELKPKQAQAKMIELLSAEGKLLKQTQIIHAVKCAERSGTPIEIIPTHQWFIQIMDKKEELKKKSAECNWYPEWMKLRLDQWIDGLKEDWCISRQRYFGIPIPAWEVLTEDESNPGHFVSKKYVLPHPDDVPVNPLADLPRGYTLIKNNKLWFEAKEESTGKKVSIIPDKDILDTWATSSISPQLSSKGINRYYLSSSDKAHSAADPRIHQDKMDPRVKPENDNPFVLDELRHQQLFPADLRPQAHEIIRTWAFYTIVKAYLHENTIPWKNLMISGWCLAADKTKMSKSKGNVVTPVALIEEKGADAVRYWASTSRLGADTAFSEDLLKIGKKLVNKLWNAAKFAAPHLTNIKEKPGTVAEDIANGIISEPLDLWILTRLNRAITKATQEFEKFEYCDARVAIEDFFWNDFCDNYLEMVKVRAYGGEVGDQRSEVGILTSDLRPPTSAIHTLHHTLNAILRLFAPFVPHITEEIYSHIFGGGESIHARGMWPNSQDYLLLEAEEAAGIAAVGILNSVRKIKAEKKISLKTPLESLIIDVPPAKAPSLALLKKLEFDLKSVTNAGEIIWRTGAQNNDFSVQVKFSEEAKEKSQVPSP